MSNHTTIVQTLLATMIVRHESGLDIAPGEMIQLMLAMHRQSVAMEERIQILEHQEEGGRG